MGVYMVKKSDIKRNTKCTVCNGKGLVPVRFYMRNTIIICQACKGSGKDKLMKNN